MLISTIAPRDLVEHTPRIDVRSFTKALRRYPPGTRMTGKGTGVTFAVALARTPPGDAYGAASAPGELVATFHGVGDVRASLVALPAGFGGVRVLAECPACGSAVAVLYGSTKRRALACRRCLGLAYASQRRTTFDTARVRRMRASRALGLEDDGSDSCAGAWPVSRADKPRRMRWATFWRLHGQHMRACDDLHESTMDEYRRILGRRFRSSFGLGAYLHGDARLRHVADPMV